MRIKSIPTFAFLALISFCSCAQTNEQYFKLNWPVGQKKLISISRNAKEFRNGKLTRDTTALVTNTLTITSANDSVYFVDYRIENELVKFGSTLYKDLKTEFTGDSYIVLNYRINKTTSKAIPVNTLKADSTIDESYNHIIKILESKVPDKISKSRENFDLLYKELKGFQFESNELFPILLYSYNRKFAIGDTLITLDSLSNPFKLEKFAGAKIKTYISKKTNKSIEITIDKTYDFEAYKSMMKELTDKMNGASIPTLKGTEQLTGLMSSLLGSVNFDAKESMAISRMSDSLWPSKITQHSTLKVKGPDNESSAIVSTTIEIK